MTDYFNQFSKILHGVSRKHGLSKVFNDLLQMGICSFHQTNIQSRLTQKDQENEWLYFETIKSYSKDELNEFGKALGLLQLNVLNNPYSDIPGDFFTWYITKGQNGQFFTPDPICQFMARITLDDKITSKRVLDPACGSGRTLLSAAKINHKNYFFGGDNDVTCAKMATLNFFLNGLKGEVSWMNSLSNEWYGGWHINMNGLGIVPIQKEDSAIWLNPPKQNNPSENKESNQHQGTQLSLF